MSGRLGGWVGRLCVVAGLLSACSPTFNWREVDTGTVPWQAVMPCKPERAERDVPLSGPLQPSTALQVMGCEAGGITYALSAVALPGGQSALAVQANWLQAGWATLGLRVESPAALPPGWLRQEVPVPGGGVAQRLEGSGRAPDGRQVQVQWWFVQRAGWLMQAAAYGAALPEAAVEPFFGGLRVR